MYVGMLLKAGAGLPGSRRASIVVCLTTACTTLRRVEGVQPKTEDAYVRYRARRELYDQVAGFYDSFPEWLSVEPMSCPSE